MDKLIWYDAHFFSGQNVFESIDVLHKAGKRHLYRLIVKGIAEMTNRLLSMVLSIHIVLNLYLIISPSWFVSFINTTFILLFQLHCIYKEYFFQIKMWLQACCICYNYLGPCLFYDNLIMERNYIVDLNGTWTVFQECNNSRIQFDTRCGSSGSWTSDMRCPAIGKKKHQIYSHT